MKTLFKSEEIQKKVEQLALNLSYKHQQDPTPVVFACVLNGGFMFFSDLVKSLIIPEFECDFIRVKSYLGQEQGEILIVKNLETNIENKHLYLIDDIFDSGRTVNYLIKTYEKYNPKSINVVTLIKRKENSHSVDNLQYLFEIDKEWVWGYGMDNEEGYYRNLPYILGK
jgi:hypoxanthine phosphoribosyltransferase